MCETKLEKFKGTTEIERKWVYKGELLDLLTNMDSCTRRFIRHTYALKFRLTQTDKYGETFYAIAKKEPVQGSELIRKEWESDIPEWVYRSILEGENKDVVGKMRYACYHQSYKGLIIEIDVFAEDLILIEVEFPSLACAEMFNITKILPQSALEVREVTNDPKYNNFNLAKDGWPK